MRIPSCARPISADARHYGVPKPAIRRLECCDGTGNKYWEVSVDATDVAVRFGCIGTAGQNSVNGFAYVAAKDVEKLIKEKTVNGYK